MCYEWHRVCVCGKCGKQFWKATPPALCVVGEEIQAWKTRYAYVRDALKAAKHPLTAVFYENWLPLPTDLCPEFKLENDMQHIKRVGREDERRVQSEFHEETELYEGNQRREEEEMQGKEKERRPTFDFGRLRPRVNGRCIKV